MKQRAARRSRSRPVFPTPTAQIADYARQPVALLTGLGVLSGSGDGMLHPQSKLTREQALKLAVELLAALNG